MLGIIPAAGLASRFRGIPKFLLPAPGRDQTMLELHVENLLETCERVLVATRPTWIPYLAGMSDPRVSVISFESRSMTETVVRLCDNAPTTSSFVLTMPDTLFIGESPFQKLRGPMEADLELALWQVTERQIGSVGQVLMDDNNKVLEAVDKLLTCPFPWMWGAMRFTRALLPIMDVSTPHVGYAINPAIHAGLDVLGRTVKGKYFDLGSFEGYHAAYKEWITQES